MHSTMLSERASLLPSRAIGNVLFPTYEAMIMSSLHSNDLLFVERIKCNIPLVDNHGLRLGYVDFSEVNNIVTIHKLF